MTNGESGWAKECKMTNAGYKARMDTNRDKSIPWTKKTDTKEQGAWNRGQK